MTSSTLARVRHFLRRRKPSAKDNIERSEPEQMLASSAGFVTSLVVTTTLMMLIYSIMSGQMAEWIGAFLANQNNNFTFDERLAGFTASVFALTSLVITMGLELSRQASHDDIVDVVNDLGEQIEERFAEFEDRTAEELANIRKEINDGIPQ